MADSVFFTQAHGALSAECIRLDDLCTSLDGDPSAKKERITEYKCAKYRYAGVFRMLHHLYYCNRVMGMGKIHLPTKDALGERPDYQALVNEAAEEDRLDYHMYYGVRAIAEKEAADYESKLEGATDWEKIELNERLGGLYFAIDCLDKAWAERKGVKQ